MYLHLERAEHEQAAVPKFTWAPEASAPSLTPSLARSLTHSLAQTLQLPITGAASTAMEIFA